MVEKLENAIARNPFVVVVLLLLAGGGGTFAGRLTAPSQDAKIAVLEERILQLCETRADEKSELAQIRKELQQLSLSNESIKERLENLKKQQDDFSKKLSLKFQLDAYMHAQKGEHYGNMCEVPINN